jgi:hypothetical protein
MGFHLENQWCALGTKFIGLLFLAKISNFWPIVKVAICQKKNQLFLIQNIQNSGQKIQ